MKIYLFQKEILFLLWLEMPFHVGVITGTYDKKVAVCCIDVLN